MNYLKYVNIKQGTFNRPDFSNGNILPVVGLPFGMTSFVLENDNPVSNWFYNPMSKVSTGLRLTHQPSPWIADYGQLNIMPVSGEREKFWSMCHSFFKPEKTVMTPNYINVRFEQFRTVLELTPTLRGAAGRMTWDNNDTTHRILIVNKQAGTEFKFCPEQRRVYGYTKVNKESVQSDYAEYFMFEFDCDFDLESSETSAGKINSESVSGVGISLNLSFKGCKSNTVNFKFVTSFISYSQLENTYNYELGGKSFEDIKAEGEAIWENHLSKIEIESDDEEQLKTFYSAMYRTLLFPRTFYEIDESGKKLHYNTASGGVNEGIMYVDNGYWDTYKTLFPLFSIIMPQMYSELLSGMLNYYNESGWLPKWLSPGERGCMPGTMVDAIVADAVAKGILTDKAEISKFLEGMEKHANQKSDNPVHGRDGIEKFTKYSFVTSDVKESVNKTLDYSYCDFCIYVVAKSLGKEEIAQKYLKRSMNYKALADKESGLMRAKDENGNRRSDWTSFDWGGDYCEGSAWQNSFAVYHDLAGMAAEVGGKEKMLSTLNTLFATPPYFKPYGYGAQIHEMAEMAAADFGQCAISNQPSFHIPYIYSVLGEPQKTAYWVRRAVDELFSSGVEGYPGDEDNGSMSGWYIFSTMGFYPVCPGVPQYVLGSPAVKKCVIHLENGKDFVVDAPNNSKSNVYISAVKLNEKESHKTYFCHSDIANGGKICFNMQSEKPQQSFKDSELPFSVYKDIKPQ